MRHHFACFAQFLLVLGPLVAGCDAPGSAPAPSPATASPTMVAASAVPSATAPPYAVEVKGWEGPVGEEGYVLVSVVAKNGLKINKDYPQRVQLDDGGAALELPLRKVEMKHAQLDGEGRLVFTLPATPKVVGEHRLKGKLKLSVCSGDLCHTATESLDAPVTAQ